MLRLITSRRLAALETRLASLESENKQVRAAAHAVNKERALVEQARDFYKIDAAEWKGRASRLIDQIGVTAGVLVAPAMQDPAAPRPSEVRGIMSALNRHEKTSRADPQPSTPSAGILGVDQDLAAAAVAAVIT